MSCFISLSVVLMGAVGWGVAGASCTPVQSSSFGVSDFVGVRGGGAVHEHRSRAGCFPYGGKLDLAGASMVVTDSRQCKSWASVAAVRVMCGRLVPSL